MQYLQLDILLEGAPWTKSLNILSLTNHGFLCAKYIESRTKKKSGIQKENCSSAIGDQSLINIIRQSRRFPYQILLCPANLQWRPPYPLLSHPQPPCLTTTRLIVRPRPHQNQTCCIIWFLNSKRPYQSIWRERENKPQRLQKERKANWHLLQPRQKIKKMRSSKSSHPPR